MKKYYLFIKYILCAPVFLCAIILNILFIKLPNNIGHSSGYETRQIVYAKVLDNCRLYKTSEMIDDVGQFYFYIPSTYFVSIINELNDQVYQVQYSSFVGYVYSSYLNKVSFTPIDPELCNITFEIVKDAGTQIWSLPSASKGSKLTTIPAGSINIEYIASTTGEIPLGGTVNLWYYARYTPSSNSTKVYDGYIYSEATTNLTNIPNNLEVEIPDTNSTLDNSISLEKPLQIIMIILICLPFVILLFAGLIKLIKHIRSQKQLNSQETPQPKPANTTYTKKHTIRKQANFNNSFEPVETIEVAFPQYDYIDDDDLLW